MKREFVAEPGARQATLGMLFTGLCTTAASVLIVLLQERYRLSYVWSGVFLSALSAGQLLANLLTGAFARRLPRASVAIFTAGAAVGYPLMALTDQPIVLTLAFALVGMSKGCTLNTSSVLIAQAPLEKTKGLNLIHACYAFGALLSPLTVTLFSSSSFWQLPLLVTAIPGVGLWLTFTLRSTQSASERSLRAADVWTFLRERSFWRLAGLLFFETASESSVTGWLVSYYRGIGVLPDAFSQYSVTIIWGVMLLTRLYIVFVMRPMRTERMLLLVGAGCVLSYAALILVPLPALSIIALVVFSVFIAGANPTVVASAGKMLTPQGVSVLLPIGALGAILMPMLIGVIVDVAGLQAGMGCILLTLTGFLALAIHENHCSKQNSKPESITE